MSTPPNPPEDNNSTNQEETTLTPHISAPRTLDDTTKYVVLCETNGKECESWYYFIKYDGNQKALEYLQKQLEKIDMYILDDLSTFDLDLDHFFTQETATEMTRLEINSYMFHRRFDGELDMIHLDLRRKDDNEDKLQKVNDKLAYGLIEDYIGDEYESGSNENENENVSESEDELLIEPPVPIKSEPKPTIQIGGGMRRKKKKKRK